MPGLVVQRRLRQHCGQRGSRVPLPGGASQGSEQGSARSLALFPSRRPDLKCFQSAEASAGHFCFPA